MGLGPLWVRRHLQDQSAGAITLLEEIPSQAVSLKKATTPSHAASVTPASAVLSKPSIEMDGPPSWLGETDAVVSVSPMPIPHTDSLDEKIATHVDVSDMDWPLLEGIVAVCQQCGLCESRKNTVFGVGDQKAKWLFVGEGPGRNEDIQGEPFVGKAGQLLDNMLLALNMKRGENVYIANVVKCRPTDEKGKDRLPSQEEVSACLPYLKRQIALVQPTVIVALGHTAAWALLGIDPAVSVGKLRGKIHHYESLPVIVTYHPSYLLRQPQDKAQAWKDLCLALSAYDGTVQ